MIAQANLQIGSCKKQQANTLPAGHGANVEKLTQQQPAPEQSKIADICYCPKAGGCEGQLRLCIPPPFTQRGSCSAFSRQLSVSDTLAGQAPDHQPHAMPPSSSDSCGPSPR